MDLARALTKRVKRTESSVHRVGSIRDQISSPVALISSTNILSYNAPDIVSTQCATSDDSDSTPPLTPTRHSFDADSDASTPSNASTHPSSIDSSPSSRKSPAHSYFQKIIQNDDADDALEVDTAPVLPKRALSHSKREHERLSRQRSLRLSRSSSQSMRGSDTTRSSLDPAHNETQTMKIEPLSVNPFSRELEQLDEVAEEFGAASMDVAAQDDLKVIQFRGLVVFKASEYIRDIQALWDAAFVEPDRNDDQIWV